MLKIELIDPATRLPPPHLLIAGFAESRTVYAIEDSVLYTVRLTWDANELLPLSGQTREQPRVELLLGVDGRNGLSDVEEFDDAPPIALSCPGMVLDQGVYMRGAPWFMGHNDRRRGPDLAGVVWAAIFLASETGDGARILPSRVGSEMWTRSKNPRCRRIAMVEFDTHKRLMERGIFVPLLNPYGPPS